MNANARPPSKQTLIEATTTTAMPALDIRNVSFRYANKQALKAVSLSINTAERVMVLGANGAGKSTLFSLICGLFAADTGSIAINGRSLHQQSAIALAPLGIVFQSQTLDLDLSVEQNLKYFCALHGIKHAEAKSRIDAALQRLDLMAQKKHRVRTLNGGHRRRVEIARATLHQPKLLLLDEPTVGLDIPTRDELIHYIHALPQTHGCAVLWATHLIDEIGANDRVLMLNEGQIHHDGIASQLCAKASVSDLTALMHQVMTS